MAKDEKETPLEGVVKSWIKIFFVEQWQLVWSSLSDFIPKLFQKIANNKLGLFTREEGEPFVHIANDAVKAGFLTEEDKTVLKEYCKSFGAMWWLPYALTIMSIVMSEIKVKGEMFLSDRHQALASKLSPSLPGPGDIIPAAFIAPEKTGEVRDNLKKLGLKDKDIDLMFLSHYRLYDPSTVQTLYLRGKIDKNKVYERMRELGFTDTRTDEMVQAWPEIPPIPDLIRMAVREAFTPEIAERFGQYQDFPGDVVPHAAAQGLDAEWVKRYWAAHWDLPSVQMGDEMFHRGIIDIDDLKLLYRALDIMPFWRDKLIQVAYVPFTRVDIRRMHKLGVLKDEDLPRVHQDIGYSPEKAEMLSRFVMELNRADKVNLSKASILKAFKLKSITETECREMLVASGVRAGEADWYISQEKLNQDIEIQQEILDNIGLRYTNNLMTKADAVVRLNKLTLPSEQINMLLDRWEIKRYLDMKVPSRTDLGKMYIAKKLTKDKYQLGMTRLGYGAADIYNFMDYMDSTKKPI